MKIKEIIRSAREVLGEKGSILDIELLLAHAMDVDRSYLLAHDDEEIEEGDRAMFNSYLKRVSGGEPVAYITNEKEFFALNFFVDGRVLIPRPETEHMVEEALKYLKENDDSGVRFKILDVGTGSGCVPIALLKNFEGKGMIERADMVDISPDALEVARINVEQFFLEDKAEVFESDLLEEIEEGAYYDVVTANLPYIGKVKNNYVSEETERFEPNLALFGGEDGLELYKKMFQQFVAKDIRFGVLLGEFGSSQGESIKALLSNYFDQDWEVKEDLAGIERMFIVKQ